MTIFLCHPVFGSKWKHENLYRYLFMYCIPVPMSNTAAQNILTCLRRMKNYVMDRQTQAHLNNSLLPTRKGFIETGLPSHQ